jgi:hypothetical protein
MISRLAKGLAPHLLSTADLLSSEPQTAIISICHDRRTVMLTVCDVNTAVTTAAAITTPSCTAVCLQCISDKRCRRLLGNSLQYTTDTAAAAAAAAAAMRHHRLLSALKTLQL